MNGWQLWKRNAYFSNETEQSTKKMNEIKSVTDLPIPMWLVLKYRWTVQIVALVLCSC